MTQTVEGQITPFLLTVGSWAALCGFLPGRYANSFKLPTQGVTEEGFTYGVSRTLNTLKYISLRGRVYRYLTDIFKRFFDKQFSLGTLKMASLPRGNICKDVRAGSSFLKSFFTFAQFGGLLSNAMRLSLLHVAYFRYFKPRYVRKGLRPPVFMQIAF